MNPYISISLIIVYFVFLYFLAHIVSKNATNESFFTGNKNSHWLLVSFGMIGTSLSGVTFVSVPGTVAQNGFSYMQVVFGYVVGYIVIAFVLTPLYYKLKVVSIYNYLQIRFGTIAYKSGAIFFIISRTVGATGRLYLVINVLQVFVVEAIGIPFWTTTLVIIGMILLYTFRGGVKTIVYTDVLQTSFMLGGLIFCIFFLLKVLNISVYESFLQLADANYTFLYNDDVNSEKYFWKEFIGGVFIAIAMTGLDQEMMQKNISVKNLHDTQKNIMLLSIIIVCVNFLFLFLGGLLYIYAKQNGLPFMGDDIFPSVAIYHFPAFLSFIFIIALISALFPSADGALTALTSSFCVDILEVHKKKYSESLLSKQRVRVHFIFACIFFLAVLFFKWMNDKSIVYKILVLAGYTYGPLLGLFSFGILTKRSIPNTYIVPFFCMVSVVFSYFLNILIPIFTNGFHIGIELLILNGIITFLLLFVISKKK